MKKKIIYSILFVSIFLLSTASMVQPVSGYEFGVPKEAVGMTTQGEVKIFDEDEVDDHLGAGVDLDGLHAGDSDVVGAKSATHYTGIEKDEEINYLHDFVFKPAGIPDTINDIYDVLQSASYNLTAYKKGTYGNFGWLANWSLHSYPNLGLGLPGTGIWQFYGMNTLLDQVILATFNEAGLALQEIMAFPNYDYFKGMYSEKYDGVIVDRETWDFTEDEADLDDNPDDDDNPAPFFADPRDWADVANNLIGAERDIGKKMDNIQDHWADLGNLIDSSGTDPTGAGWYGWLLTLCGALNGTHPVLFPDMATTFSRVYEPINDTIVDQLSRIPSSSKADLLVGDCITMEVPLSMYLSGAMGVESNLSDQFGLPGGTFPDYQEDYVQGLMGLGDYVFELTYATIHAYIPDKAGFFLGQLIAGQPAMTPSGDFMEKVIDEYNIKEDTLYDMYGFQYGKDLPNDDGLIDCEISAIPVGTKSRFTGVDLGGETIYPQAYIEFDWDGSAVIAEIEWPDDYIDPKDSLLWPGIYKGDGEDELEDFEIAFLYGDTGGQGSVSYMDGNDIFWQMGGVEQIPGFEITIILGASAISIIGLIYVIMKKRKR